MKRGIYDIGDLRLPSGYSTPAQHPENLELAASHINIE